ncbi:alpha/beta hydrolase [Devosia sp.]|uniref:alpha/beta fold hydrolase n=1 Tax=Devosia sp. TaxID=1871048 RepID=UPI002AFF8ADE|nr:alpha/beta hydrolase [Devosia sp.]
MSAVTHCQVNGVSLRSVLDGADGGETLICLHELGGSLNSFDALHERLASRHRLLRFDQRGAGLSEKASGTLDIDTLCDDVAGLLDFYDIKAPVVVLGAAVGAAIACRFALRHPERVKALALAAPALHIPAERRAAGHDMAERLDRDGMRAIADTVLSRSFPEALWSSEAEKQRAIARWLGADPQGYAATYRMLIELELVPDLHRIAVPALILAGIEDPHAPPAFLETLTAALPKRHLVSLEAGHFMGVQSPDTVAAALGDFLSRL